MRTFTDFNNTSRLITEPAANPVIPPVQQTDFLKSDHEIEAEFLYNLNKKPDIKAIPPYKKQRGKAKDPARLLKHLEATSTLEENY
jgi:hypothetical protein